MNFCYGQFRQYDSLVIKANDKTLLRLLIVCVLAGCGQAERKPAPKVPAPLNGSLIYKQHCVSCHGTDGTLGANGATNLTLSALSREEVIEVISNGRKVMTPFKTILSEEEIKTVAEYVMEMRQKASYK